MGKTQAGPDLNQCLTQLAYVLKRFGVEEFSISDDHHYHTVNTEVEIDADLAGEFCTSITQVYAQMAKGDEALL